MTLSYQSYATPNTDPDNKENSLDTITIVVNKESFLVNEGRAQFSYANYNTIVFNTTFGGGLYENKN